MSIFNKIIASLAGLMPESAVRLFSQRYIAGETLDDAVKVVQRLNSQGILATIDLLGEEVKNKEEAVKSKNECLQVQEAIHEHGLNSNLSIKLTQLGLNIDRELTVTHLSELADKAKKMNNFVRIDMEDSSYTESTIDLFTEIFPSYQNVGIVLQAYLKRTYSDVVTLAKLGTNFRLCKGIYIEPAGIAYKDRRIIRDNYIKCLEAILRNGNYVGIATHDEYLIEEAFRLIKQFNVSNDRFEFQMLLGVREDLRDKINSGGYKIRIYVPFGKDWYAYSIRRLKENPQIAGHIFKNIFSFRK